MRILALLTDPGAVRPILRHLHIPQRPPPVSPARGPPQTELIAVDAPSPWDPGGYPATGRDPFDQSLPGDDGTWTARADAPPTPRGTGAGRRPHAHRPTTHQADPPAHPPAAASRASSRHDRKGRITILAPRKPTPPQSLHPGPTPVGFPIRFGWISYPSMRPSGTLPPHALARTDARALSALSQPSSRCHIVETRAGASGVASTRHSGAVSWPSFTAPPHPRRLALLLQRNRFRQTEGSRGWVVGSSPTSEATNTGQRARPYPGPFGDPRGLWTLTPSSAHRPDEDAAHIRARLAAAVGGGQRDLVPHAETVVRVAEPTSSTSLYHMPSESSKSS